MLIRGASQKPNLEAVRRIKRSLHDALGLPEDALITVAQLACLEEGCAPVETVIGLLRSGEAQRQHKVHKPTDRIDTADLVEVCTAWGFPIDISFFNTHFNEV